MKRALAWIAGLAGIAALGRHLSRRAATSTPTVDPADTTADPAEALRSKLAAQQTEAPAKDPDPEPEPEPETLEARRARVHAKAQAAIGEMDEPVDP